MYATALLCAAFGCDPFVVLVPLACAFFVFGYVLQRL